MSWTWIALLIEILGVIAVFVLVFLIARSLIRYANSLKTRRRFFKAGSRRQKNHSSRFVKIVTRHITCTHSYNEVKMRNN